VPSINKVEITKKFRSLYKKKLSSSPKYLVEKIDKALLDLRSSEVPESLGEFKKGKLADSLAYRINKETRILYEVERENGICKITFLRVCNHKQVYGKD